MTEFDEKMLPEILADRIGERFEWTNAHVLRFLDKMFAKGAVELPQLWKIYPQQMTALMMHYGWSLKSMEDTISHWSRSGR